MFEKISVSATRGKPAATVVGVFKDKKLDKATAGVDGQIGRAIKRAEFTGEAGSLVEVFPEKAPGRVIVAGLGERKEFKAGTLRGVAASVGRRLANTKETPVSVALAEAMKGEKVDLEEAGQCFGEGLGLIGWNYDRFRGTAAKNPERKPGKLTVGSDAAAFTSGLKKGLALAESTNIARDLSQTPANVANTSYMASQARALAKRVGLTCRVIQGDELEKEKLQGLINVGKASEHGPCLIRLEYRPSGGSGGRGKKKTSRKGTAKPVVLVGKTMVYDTGGLSLKVGGSMPGMKRDKDGGCAVFGAMHAIATQIKPKVPVVALLSCAENSISDEAYRPDDVITYRNGVTVEVTNTDAEGRLVLADALCWACDKENPACIIDLATLTGGVVVALGATYAGLWCDDDELRGRLERAMEASGERWWRLPHDSEYRELMRSPIADILNSAPVRQAHPIQGAAFLSYFVKEGIPWAHIDIAGVHATDSDKGPFVKGPTGWGVRLLAEMVEEW